MTFCVVMLLLIWVYWKNGYEFRLRLVFIALDNSLNCESIAACTYSQFTDVPACLCIPSELFRLNI